MSKFKNNVSNTYANSSSEAEEILRKIPLYQKRKTWEKEFTQAKQTFSIDESLEILSTEKIQEYERAIIELPMYQTREKQYQDSLKETSESLNEAEKKLSLFSYSSSELETLIQTLSENLQNLESSKIKIVEYTKINCIGHGPTLDKSLL
jgi:uroporphyrinogen-III synthase